MTEQINWHPNGTPGPWIADDFLCEGDHAVRVAMPNVRTMPGATVMMAEHNWNDAEFGERRISWKEAETNTRAAAEIPAMVAALRKVAKVIDFDGWAFSNEIRAILARIDGEA